MSIRNSNKDFPCFCLVMIVLWVPLVLALLVIILELAGVHIWS